MKSKFDAAKKVVLLALICVLAFASAAVARTAQLPAALLAIEDEAFMGNASLENVILPEKLTAIGARAFADCANMETIYIPASVTEIADDAFAGCEHLTFRCGWGSYAAVFAAKHIAQYPGCSVEMLGDMPLELSVSLSVSRLMCEGGEIDLVWEVMPNSVQSGDLCELVVMLGGEEYKRFEKSSSLRYALTESHETPVTGEMYAICYYEHADGTTSQAISEKTQLVGGMSAELLAMETTTRKGNYAVWELSVQGAAGTPVVQYTVYKGNDVYAQSGYVTDLRYRILLEESGEYTAQAHIVDGLEREAVAGGAVVTVNTYTGSADPLTYRLNEDGETYAVVGCDISAESVRIPDEWNDCRVTAIADGAFAACENLKAIRMSKYVEKIGANAFYGCAALNEITYNTGVKEIGEGVFSGCASLSAYTLPAAMESIPARLFENCTSMTSVTLPSAAAEIGANAFSGCASLTRIVWNTSVKRIGASAFAGCAALRTTALPEGLVSIGESAFSGCVLLSGVLFPQSVESIGDRAFASCVQLETVTLPESLASLGASAFVGCEKLGAVSFGNADTQIGSNAFAYCADAEIQVCGDGSVKRWALEAGVDVLDTSIPMLKAFEAVEGEYRVNHSMSWRVQVGYGAEPYSCSFEVFCDGEPVYRGEAQAANVFAYTPEKEGVYHAAVTVLDAAGKQVSGQSPAVEVLEAVDSLPYLKYEFNQAGNGYVITGLQNYDSTVYYDVVIPAEIDGVPVKAIEYKAFYECENLKSVVIMNDLDNIGDLAFAKCVNLEKVVLPNNLEYTDIGSEFEDCTKLSELIIPYGVKSLPDFSGCTTLKSVYIPETVTNYSDFVGCTGLIRVVSDSMVVPDLEGCTSLKTVEINAPVTDINPDNFKNCVSLESVTGLGYVSYISNVAFAYCESLIEIELGTYVDNLIVGDSAFLGCKSLKKVSIAEQCSWNAGEQAFMNCLSLEKIRVTYAKKKAFFGCTGLKEVSGLIGAYDSAFENCISLELVTGRTSDSAIEVYPYAFRNCKNLRMVQGYIYTGSGNGSSNAFKGCSSLECIRMSKATSVRVGMEMFADCTSLRTVENIEYVRYFGSRAFKNCTSLEIHDIGRTGSSGTRSIGFQAFANCISLTHLVIKETLGASFQSIDEDAFVGCVNLVVDTTDACNYAKNYFAAHPEFGTPAHDALNVSITGDVDWDELDPADGTVQARITVYNTKDGPAVSGSEWAQALEAAKMKNAGLAVYSSCMSVRHLGDKEATYPADTAAVVHLLGDLAYRSSASATVELQCRSEDPASCKHGDLRVLISSDGRGDVLITSPAAVKYTDECNGDYTVEKATTLSGDLTVNGDVHVKALLNLEGAKLRATGDVILYEGGTVRMTGKSGLTAQEIDVQQGGALELDSFAQVSADSVSDAGLLSLMSDACRVTADDFSVTGAGVLAMDANGEIHTQSFLFDTASDHSGMLSDGVITAHTARMKRNFMASGNHMFILQGGACMLDVERTSPKQRFSAMAIDCGIGNLTVEGFNTLLGLPFVCDHFVLSEESVLNQVKKSNDIFKEIYEKYTAAKFEQLAAEEEKLAGEMDGWYNLTLSSGDIGGAKKAATYAKKALVRWAVGSAADAPDKWSDVNDILRSILAANTGGAYAFKDGFRDYEVTVKPLGGLTVTKAATSAGTIECVCGGETYEFIFSLNHHGVQQGAGRVLDVMHRYAENEYLSNIHKAVEGVVGKEYAKYALGMLEVIEQSISEEKEIYQVILEKYGKEPAERLIKNMMPKARIQAAFYSKWNKYIKPVKDVLDMAEETRKGNELPNDLMREFLNLAENAL